MRDYLNKMKTIMDSFALIDDILSIRDQILAITAGLGHDYESITVQITSNLNAYKLTDVIGLFAHEKQLEQYNIHASSVIPTANVAYQNPQKKFSYPTQGNSSQNLGSFHGLSGTKFHGSEGAIGQGYGGITVPSLSVNFVGRWVTFFSNVTIVLTHSSLVSLITIHTHILVLLHQDLLAMQAIVVAPNTQDDGVWFLDSGV